MKKLLTLVTLIVLLSLTLSQIAPEDKQVVKIPEPQSHESIDIAMAPLVEVAKPEPVQEVVPVQASLPVPGSDPVVVEQQAKAEPECGLADPRRVYNIMISIGVPRVSAIQQLGSWKWESGGLNPCQQRGDGGEAWGLNSWHSGRRYDMPFDLTEQVKWAILTEMPRDCRSCYDQFMSAPDAYTAREAIRKSTRWGIVGNRWQYADEFASIL
jgi:hypothetical protein